ncbi:hypothetical protein Hanom_Chr16g01480671 [Helianthus anomalus]
MIRNRYKTNTLIVDHVTIRCLFSRILIGGSFVSPKPFSVNILPSSPWWHRHLLLLHRLLYGSRHYFYYFFEIFNFES